VVVLAGQSDIDRGHELFERHGGKVVLLARCVPFLRSVVSIPAGVLGMPLPRFVTVTAVGSGAWNAVFIAAGWWLGERWDRVQSWLGPASYAVIALLAVGVVVLAVRRRRSSAPHR